MLISFFCILYFSVSSLAATPIPENTTWAILAWGFDGGGKDNTNGVRLVDLDIDTQKDLIPKFKSEGKIVICYFSSGTLEPWRQDCQNNKDAWQAAAVGQMSGWDEAWLDIRKIDQLKQLMIPRFKRALSNNFSEGCDGVEPDNIDCYQNEDCWGSMINPTVSSGNELLQQQLDWNIWQASYAHSLGLSVAMKNAIGLIPQLASYYDCAVNEQCQTYGECSAYSLFAGKAVFQVEYTSNSNFCNGGRQYKMMTKYCDGNNDGLCSDGSSWIDCWKRL